MNKRTTNYAFIDSQNVNLAIRAQGWILNFGKFRRYLADKYYVKKAFIFIGYVPRYQKLYQYLKKQGYILIFKPTTNFPPGKTKGNIDAELVLHAMIEYSNYDQAVIISGDGDFYCLVKYLLKKEKLLAIMIPDHNRYSSLLRKFIKKIVYLSFLREKLALRSK